MRNVVFLTACFLALSALAPGQKTDSDVTKRIAEATPEALPQQVHAASESNDLRHANLVGPVKSVATSVIDHEQRRTAAVLQTEEFYNEFGNRVRSIHYDDDGNPRSIGVFGFIDGMRVVRWGSIKDAKGQEAPPPPRVEVPVGVTQRPTKKDGRYDMRYVYKYDSRGRLIEEEHISSTGERVVAVFISYETPKRRLLRNFYAKGTEEIARTVELLDDSGNVVEEWFFDEFKKVSFVREMRYEFDSKGNWTTQKVFERVKGKTELKPISTTYRIITYYQ